LPYKLCYDSHKAARDGASGMGPARRADPAVAITHATAPDAPRAFPARARRPVGALIEVG